MGLSKVTHFNTVITTCSGKEKSQSGTPVYQAQELLLTHKKASRESDIWNLTCTLCELYSEEPIWNLGDEDNIDLLIDCMSRNEKTHCLRSNAIMESQKEFLDTLCKGLDYDPSQRPVAVDMCCALKF